MAKGITIFGTLNGTLGDTVYYRSGGEQKQRIRIRKPKNPQTNKQLFQRARFASAGMFYTHGRQSFFPYAFEDKRPNESNFNAFMRNNIALAYPVSKSVVDNVAYPILNDWIVTKGSLPTLNVKLYQPVEGDLTRPAITFPIGMISSAPTTMADLSRILINTGDFEEGDIITFLNIQTDLNITNPAYGMYPEIAPLQNTAAHWFIRQFNVNTRDNTPLISYNFGVTIEPNDSLYIYNVGPNMQFGNSQLAAGTVIHSRVRGSRTMVSTQQLVLSATAESQLKKFLVGNYQQYVEEVIANWRTGDVSTVIRPEETLQGANSINLDFTPEPQAALNVRYTAGQISNGVLKPASSLIGSNAPANTNVIEFTFYLNDEPILVDSISIWDEIRNREITVDSGTTSIIYAGTLQNGSNWVTELDTKNIAILIKSLQASTSPIATLGGVRITKVVIDGTTYTNFTYEDATTGE